MKITKGFKKILKKDTIINKIAVRVVCVKYFNYLSISLWEEQRKIIT